MANLLISSHFHDCLQYYQAVRKWISGFWRCENNIIYFFLNNWESCLNLVLKYLNTFITLYVRIIWKSVLSNRYIKRGTQAEVKTRGFHMILYIFKYFSFPVLYFKLKNCKKIILFLNKNTNKLACMLPRHLIERIVFWLIICNYTKTHLKQLHGYNYQVTDSTSG